MQSYVDWPLNQGGKWQQSAQLRGWTHERQLGVSRDTEGYQKWSELSVLLELTERGREGDRGCERGLEKTGERQASERMKQILLTWLLCSYNTGQNTLKQRLSVRSMWDIPNKKQITEHLFKQILLMMINDINALQTIINTKAHKLWNMKQVFQPVDMWCHHTVWWHHCSHLKHNLQRHVQGKSLEQLVKLSWTSKTGTSKTCRSRTCTSKTGTSKTRTNETWTSKTCRNSPHWLGENTRAEPRNFAAVYLTITDTSPPPPDPSPGPHSGSMCSPGPHSGSMCSPGPHSGSMCSPGPMRCRAQTATQLLSECPQSARWCAPCAWVYSGWEMRRRRRRRRRRTVRHLTGVCNPLAPSGAAESAPCPGTSGVRARCGSAIWWPSRSADSDAVALSSDWLWWASRFLTESCSEYEAHTVDLVPTGCRINRTPQGLFGPVWVNNTDKFYFPNQLRGRWSQTLL